MDNGGETSTIENAQNGEPLNISDVFEAITLADPMTFAEMAQPYVHIIEQPASKALRFRYECEGRSAGSIPGVNSTSENKTYPTIKISNYVGQVVIVVSCVTKDMPYKTHPHSLVGRERCHKGVCTIPIRISEDCNEYQFKNLGIQCVKRRDIAKALSVRQEIKVDPFKAGFDHMEHPQGIDLNAVRLCFQVFLPNAAGHCRRALAPVVSDIIFDKKAMSDLLIVRASHCSGTARGGTQVIILCEKVTREDTVVVFFLEENNEVVWEEAANTILVHKQVAIVFETPAFRDKNITQHVSVRFQLKRVTDNARSNSLPFEYIPEIPDLRYKRKKVSSLLESYESERGMYQADQAIKTEPRDKTPPYLPQYGEEWGAMAVNRQGAGVPGSSTNPFATHMWGEQSYVTSPPMHMQNMQQLPSSNLQPVYNLQPMSPNNPMSPPMQVMSPHGQTMSPHGQTMSPHGQTMSPHGQTMSPHAQTMSPHRQTLSPLGQAMSPHAQSMPAHGQTMSPHGQSMTPHGQTLSPHPQAISPHGQVLSPYSDTMSPNLQVMSPQHMGRISPNMQHPQQNMGHISPNLVQQPAYVQMQQQNLMDTDNNSTPSLSTLLDRGEGILLNSGELSGLSSLLGD